MARKSGYALRDSKSQKEGPKNQVGRLRVRSKKELAQVSGPIRHFHLSLTQGGESRTSNGRLVPTYAGTGILYRTIDSSGIIDSLSKAKHTPRDFKRKLILNKTTRPNRCHVILWLEIVLLSTTRAMYYYFCAFFYTCNSGSGMRIKGKTVWVVGASAGIGEHGAYECARRGASKISRALC